MSAVPVTPPVQVLQAFGLSDASAAPLGHGLVNRTWKLTRPAGEAFVLQQLNTAVFSQPRHLAANHRQLADYFTKNHPQYPFVTPLTAVDGKDLVWHGGAAYRLLPFVAGSQAIDTVQSPEQAFAAAAAFAKFTRLLADFDTASLHITIPHFHDLPLRYRQFLKAVEEAIPNRSKQAGDLVAWLQQQHSIVTAYERLVRKGCLQVRVTHHDTKISNVLFNEANKVLCVIDLDTVMPGYFLSDVGDMLRTYVPPVNEEESDTGKIVVRKPFYQAVLEGYRSEMSDVLSDTEQDLFSFAGEVMVYMQALRFLTDYLLGDPYYGARYEGHNLVRACNQTALLRQLQTAF